MMSAAVAETMPNAFIHTFESAEKTITFCENYPWNIAFLDINMGVR